MNTKEKQLAAKMLKMASDEFSNHGCNDVEDSVLDADIRGGSGCVPDYKNAGSRLPEVAVRILEHSWQTCWGRGMKTSCSLLCVTKRLLLATLLQSRMAKNLCRSMILLLAFK